MHMSNGQAVDPDLRFSLLIPIHNEAENVVDLLDEIEDVLGPLGPFEVLTIDDASTDASRRAMEQWKDAHAAAWLRILCLEAQSGQPQRNCTI